MKILKRTLSLTLSAVMLLSVLSGCKADNKKGGFSVKPQKSSDSSLFYEADGTAVLENSGYKLELDCATTHFKVTDIKNSVIYSSVPSFESSVVSEETQKEFVSEIVIKFFDNRSGENFMYSTADSVEKNTSAVTASDDAIRVTYTFGEVNSEYFVPAVLTVDNYETILDSLSSSGRRRFGFYYELWSSAEPSDDFDAMAEKYPILKKRDLYILDDTISEADHSNIDRYMEEAGYTEEEYQKLLEELDFTVAASDKPGFIIPVEYKLSEKGFTATVLSDLIEEKSESFKLANIDLLPFFAATDATAEGYFLVPDGAGALIVLNSKKNGSYVHRFYGSDTSKLIKEQSMLTQNQYLPVFGMTNKSGAYFAVCEGAATVADLNVAVLSDSVPANSGWCTFDYRVVESVQNAQAGTAAGTAEGVYNLYGVLNSTELPSVHYMLLPPNSDYIAMAGAYREYLEANKAINSNADKGGIMLDYTCVVPVSRTFLGIPYTEKIVLTTLSDIKASLERLYKSGVKDVSVRLSGYTASGVFNNAYNSFSIYKKVGSKEELKALAKFISENGGKLYLDADFSTVYKDGSGDGFSERKDVSYYLNKTLVKAANYDVVTREINKKLSPFYVSPLKYTDFAHSFIKDIEKFSNVGAAYPYAGKILGGNYSDSACIDRSGAERAIELALASAEKAGALIGGGNIYALKSAEKLTDISLYSSEYDIQLKGVPFWQIVLHGAVGYSGIPYNTSENRTKLLLKSVEAGADLHFSFIGASDEVLIEQGLYEQYYSLSDDTRIDTVVKLYGEIYSFRQTVEGKRITGHKEWSQGVVQTIYENGAYSVVNYTDNDYRVGGITVPANGYYLKGVE